MDKKSKIFFVVFFLLLAGSVSASAYKYVFARNYIVENEIDCDPETENCFVWECDPQAVSEDEACTGDPEADIWYYKVVRRKASKVPDCDPEKDEECDPWACDPGEKNCAEIFCDEENKLAYEAECSTPEQYLENNPPEEEACEEGDEECEVEAEEDTESSEETEEACASGEENCATEEQPAESADGEAEEDAASSTETGDSGAANRNIFPLDETATAEPETGTQTEEGSAPVQTQVEPVE